MTSILEKPKLPRGRPPSPPPLVFWRLRLDIDPPQVCIDHPELAKLLHWQIILFREKRVGDDVISEPVTGLKTHVVEDDETKHRFLRSFGSAAVPIHGWLVFENEPPADAKALVRVRGAELPIAALIPLNKSEKVNKLLHEQPAEQLAQAALERPDVRDMILQLLQRQQSTPPKKKGR